MNIPESDPVPAPVPPTPAEPTPAAEPKGRTYQEQKFFANREASSLPSQVPPPQEPAPEVVPPVEPPAPVVDEPTPQLEVPPVEPQPIPEDDFSAEIPGLTPEDGVLLDTSVPHPDFPFDESAPQWQKDAFNRIQQDASLTDDDKKTIAALSPGSWDRARQWNKDTKILGRFRNEEIPISEVFDTLSRQSKTRTDQLEVEAINRVLSNPSRLTEFATEHTPVFAEVMSELVNNHSDFVANALNKRGFNVVKAEPFDVNKIKEQLKSHPLYGSLEDTDFDELLNTTIDELAAKVSTGEVTPEELAKEMQSSPSAPNSDVTARVQAIGTTIKEAQGDHWLKAIGDGLKASGIAPATPDEKTRNPAAAHLKDVIFNAALYGLPGVMSDWDSHSAKWGEKQAGYNETFTELQRQLQSGDLDSFKANAASMNPFYYEFGKSRANIGLIQNLYRAVNKMLGEAPAPPPAVPTNQPAPTITDPSIQAEPRGGTFSERRYFAQQNGK